MSIETYPYDPADYLTDEETIAEYLSLSLEGGDPKEVSEALSTVIRARGGVSKLAEEVGLNPDTLVTFLDDTDGSNLGSMLKLMHALGVKLTASKVA